MFKEIKKDNTLIVKGPSRIILVEGHLDVLGKKILPESGIPSTEGEGPNVLIIPGANHYPLFALEDSKVEIYTSNVEENVKLVSENSISDSWIDIKNEIIKEMKKSQKKPIKIMVIGISGGKTTLIKYLANNLLGEGLKGGYLDSDLGQQMYLSTTLNIGEISKPIVSNEDMKCEKTVFIGSTYPKGNLKFIVSVSCRNLIEEFLKDHPNSDFILIDSDGWIKSEAGIVYKTFFIKAIDPDVIIIFWDDDIEELKIIEEKAHSKKDRKIFLIKDRNDYYYEKDKEERRWLRQSIFSKRFENFRKITIPLDNMKFVKYEFEEDEIIEQQINVYDLIKLPYHYVIIGLLTEDSKLINIGLLFSINIEKDYILLYSDLNYKEQIKIKKILMGSLRLSTKGNHQGYLYL